MSLSEESGALRRNYRPNKKNIRKVAFGGNWHKSKPTLRKPLPKANMYGGAYMTEAKRQRIIDAWFAEGKEVADAICVNEYKLSPLYAYKLMNSRGLIPTRFEKGHTKVSTKIPDIVEILAEALASL